MGDEDNLELTEFQGALGQPPDAGQDASRPGNAKDLDAVYDIPVQVSAVLGRTSMQVSQLLKLGRGAVVELDRKGRRGGRHLRNNRLVARGEVVVVEDVSASP
jgi:flagellar motor switch protein FliN/FliY